MERRRSQELNKVVSGPLAQQGGGGLDHWPAPLARATSHQGYSSLEAPLLGLASKAGGQGGGGSLPAGPASALLGAIASPFGSFVDAVGGAGAGAAALAASSSSASPASPPLLLPDAGPASALASPLLGLASAPGSFSGGLSAASAGLSVPLLLPTTSCESRFLEAVHERDSDVASTSSGPSALLRGAAAFAAESGFAMNIQVVPPRADRLACSRDVPPRQGTSVPGGVIVEPKEWACMMSTADAASSSEDVSAPRDRFQRYSAGLRAAGLHAAAKHLAPETAEPAQSVLQETEGLDANVWRCGAWCFYFVEMFLGAASILLLAAARRWFYVLLLMPFHLVLVWLELYGVRHDPGIETLRAALRRRHSRCLRRLAIACLELAILVLCGCLCLFPLIRARRCWRQSGRGVKRRFIDEIEGTAQGGQSGDADSPSLRFDSHIKFISGVPRMVVLTNVLARTGTFHQDDILSAPLSATILSVTVVISLLSVVHAVLYFDYQGSRWIRMQYEAHRCTFQLLHVLFRSFEVAGRVLILVAITEIFRWHLYSGLALLVLDYLLGIAALYRVTEMCPSSLKMTLVLSAAVYVADVCRYIDEPGVTRQARKVSRFCTRLRFVEVILALVLYGHFASERVRLEGGLQGAGAEKLLVLTVLVHVTCFVMVSSSRIGYKGIDLFVVCRDRKASAAEIQEMLRTGCHVNQVQLDPARETALHVAAAEGQVAAVEALLLHGAEPCLTDAEGDTPLHKACRNGHIEAIVALLEPPEGAPCRLGGTCQAAALQRNAANQTPVDVLHEGTPWHCRHQLLTAQRAEEDICGGRHAALGSGPERTPSNNVAIAPLAPAPPSRSSSASDLSRNLFGSVVTRRHHRTPTSASSAGLASFMFSTGIGDQLSEALDHMQESDHGLKFSSLKLVEGGMLGRGSFGTVVKVKDTRSGELFALKKQPRDKTTKIAIREVQALLKSAHAFIVRLIHMFQTDTYYVLLMELCDKNLNAKILEFSEGQPRTDGLPEHITVRYTACITLALEYLHNLRIVFRDVKPENILVTFKEKGDYAKLTDFGLARSIDAETGCGNDGGDSPKSSGSPGGRGAELLSPRAVASVVREVCGTPRFMAEEVYETSIPAQSAGAERLDLMRWATGRDWYALGLTLLLMLLGDDGGSRVAYGERQVLLPPENQLEVWKTVKRLPRNRKANEDALRLVHELTLPVQQRAGAAELRCSDFLRSALEEMEAEARRYDKLVAEAEANKYHSAGSVSPLRRRRAGSASASGTASTAAGFLMSHPSLAAEARGARKGEAAAGARKLRHTRARSAPADPAIVG